MSRRIPLPGADELFRTTGTGGHEAAAVDAPSRALSVAGSFAASGTSDPVAQVAGSPSRPAKTSTAVRQTARPRARGGTDRQPSGRERHDEKITVYLSPEELVDLERARLTLRQE